MDFKPGMGVYASKKGTPAKERKNKIMEEEQTLRIVKKCQCGGCQKYFSGNTIFDQHRIGPSEKRRCMTEEEMKAAGMDHELCLVNVMHENKRSREQHEVWYDVEGRETMRAAFRKVDAQDEDTE